MSRSYHKQLLYDWIDGTGEGRLSTSVEAEATIGKHLRKTVVDAGHAAELTDALLEYEPKEIVRFMTKDSPRTLIDVIRKMRTGGVGMKPTAGAISAMGDALDELTDTAEAPVKKITADDVRDTVESLWAEEMDLGDIIEAVMALTGWSAMKCEAITTHLLEELEG